MDRTDLHSQNQTPRKTSPPRRPHARARPRCDRIGLWAVDFYDGNHQWQATTIGPYRKREAKRVASQWNRKQRMAKRK